MSCVIIIHCDESYGHVLVCFKYCISAGECSNALSCGMNIPRQSIKVISRIHIPQLFRINLHTHNPLSRQRIMQTQFSTFHALA